MAEASYERPVTVIALCFNHERFLRECLDSIAAQTMQDFQLIVTDDCSSDHSAEMIQSWIDAHRPDAMFVRHNKNAGLCKTLNEALSHARGEFISMIATDDVWEPRKLESQLRCMRAQPDGVAVVYSDASRIDEQSNPLAKDFIEAHFADCGRPSGQVFSTLAIRNFIPAMATLIRTAAIVEAGGYDERLTYEDYDMWLKLAARHDFTYHDEVVAKYRVVETSLVRTLLFNPSANHHYTIFLIHDRWLASRVLPNAHRPAWNSRIFDAAYGLYCLDDPRAAACLRRAARYSRRPRAILLAMASSLGISRKLAKNVTARLGLRA